MVASPWGCIRRSAAPCVLLVLAYRGGRGEQSPAGLSRRSAQSQMMSDEIQTVPVRPSVHRTLCRIFMAPFSTRTVPRSASTWKGIEEAVGVIVQAAGGRLLFPSALAIGLMLATATVRTGSAAATLSARRRNEVVLARWAVVFMSPLTRLIGARESVLATEVSTDCGWSCAACGLRHGSWLACSGGGVFQLLAFGVGIGNERGGDGFVSDGG